MYMYFEKKLSFLCFYQYWIIKKKNIYQFLDVKGPDSVLKNVVSIWNIYDKINKGVPYQSYAMPQHCNYM